VSEEAETLIDTEQREALEVSQGWWLLIIIGVSSLVAGAILVAKPSNSLATLAVVFGIFLLIDGIIELIESFGHSIENRGLAAVIGILGIIIGIILIRHPTHAVTAIGLLIGIWLVATGAVSLARAIATGSWGLLWLLIAVLKIAVGIVIIADPHIGYATLAVLSGIWLIVNGISAIVLGLGLRSVRPEVRTPPRPVQGGVADPR
jgi:uncharacterized membrane protein HdeD (DUF308 family)